MHQRKRSAIAIGGGAAGDLESELLIKVQCFGVLFIHIARQRAFQSQCVLHQQPASTTACMFRGQEQRFQLGAIQAHEAHQHAIIIGKHPQFQSRQGDVLYHWQQ